MDHSPSPLTDSQNSILKLSLTYQVHEECLLVTCAGHSNCANCIETIYKPVFSYIEDTECTGLVIDKRKIECSREKKSLNQVVDAILRYKNRSLLRKLGLVSGLEYSKDETLLRDLLFSKGVNIRIFNDLEEAIRWAQAYP
jgi:hypothetical protein